MKKTILFAVLFFTITSCGMYKYPYQKSAVVLDYSEYTDKGFFLTEANSVSFEYKTLGSVSAKVSSGYLPADAKGKVRQSVGDDIYMESNKKKTKYGKYKPAYSDDALRVLCEKAMEIEANGIINIQFTYIPPEYDPKTKMMIKPDAIMVTGMAIRK